MNPWCRWLTIALGALWAGTAQGGVPIATVLNNDHDFGTVWIGAKLDHTYRIRNDGDGVLDILDIRVSCPCTTVDADFPRKIAPGETGRITMRLDTARNIYGSFRKSIELTTNVPRARRTDLRFRGRIKEYIERSPVGVGFGRMGTDQTELKVVNLTNNTDDPVILELIGPPRQGVFAVALSDVRPGTTWRLEIRAKPPYEPYQNRATIRILTGVFEQPVVTVSCTAYVAPRLELKPPYLVRNVKLGVRKVRFINNGESPVRVESVDSDDRRIKTSFVEEREGFEYELIVVMPLGFLPKPEGNRIIIHTDDSETPEVVLRFVRDTRSITGDARSP